MLGNICYPAEKRKEGNKPPLTPCPPPGGDQARMPGRSRQPTNGKRTSPIPTPGSIRQPAEEKKRKEEKNRLPGRIRKPMKEKEKRKKKRSAR
ncbi:hypothetical protein [uncultured Desulfovibrio sp.]|uniref:hypothetical protein n=1 Tax=uncultured Desulfovibrio sp. TaxID=167968 RepID=UPI0026200941|nr:hypothetical protein [uncultured Desulfovibrio sp.]